MILATTAVSGPFSELARFVQRSRHASGQDPGRKMTRNYVVRPRKRCWVIEVDDEPVTLTASQGEALATALDAARRDAEQERIVARVTLVDERGDIVPLASFGDHADALPASSGHRVAQL